LSRHAAGRFRSLWYETCCDRTGDVVGEIERFVASHSFPLHRRGAGLPEVRRSQGPEGMEQDRKKVLDYVDSQRDRLVDWFYDEKVSCAS
jgi:hypothetical protein